MLRNNTSLSVLAKDSALLHKLFTQSIDDVTGVFCGIPVYTALTCVCRPKHPALTLPLEKTNF